MENNPNIELLRIERVRKRVKAIAGFYKHLSVYLLVNLLLLALRYFRLDPGEEFWRFETFSTAFFWGIGLAFHALGVFGTNLFLGPDWEDRKIQELMEKDKRYNKWE